MDHATKQVWVRTLQGTVASIGLAGVGTGIKSSRKVGIRHSVRRFDIGPVNQQIIWVPTLGGLRYCDRRFDIGFGSEENPSPMIPYI